MSNTKARVIAYYLPQYHPVAVNDQYWGKGFTEWTNVVKARPLFRGHEQPRLPADLGFYDLRLAAVREEQAKLAREAGVEGFCYWHYWFGNGQEVLELPFDEVVKSKTPDFPFCLGWANHEWTTKTWDKGKAVLKSAVIFPMEYPGEEDHIRHFYRYLEAFKDERYITVDGKKLFVIYDGLSLPDAKGFMALWNRLAREHGMEGFYFVSQVHTLPDLKKQVLSDVDQLARETLNRYLALGFDGVNSINLKYAEFKSGGRMRKYIGGALRRLPGVPVIEKYDYRKIIKHFYTNADTQVNIYPQLLAGWDRSPRSGRNAIIYYNRNPRTFGEAAARVLELVADKPEQHRIVFLNSWNEWGEGAYMEPDLQYGKGMIQALRSALEGSANET